MHYLKNLLQKYTWLDWILLTIGIGIVYSIFLGNYPLIAPDEARYSEIGREMLALRDYITPHLNYIPYLEKPPFFYWLQAFSAHWFGLSELAMRFWTACFGVMGCLLTYFAGKRLYDRTTGIYASLILASSVLYFSMSHLVTLDMTMSTLITATLVFFLIGTLKEKNYKKRLYIWAAFGCAALAILTKGLIGLFFPILIIGAWVLLLNKWRELKSWYLPSSILFFLLIAAPWHIVIQIKHPSFFHFYFIEQHFLRYATLSSERYEPFYFYIYVLLLGFFPWSIFLFQSLKSAWPSWHHRKENQIDIYLLLWIVLIFVFFSISKSKLIPYIVPIFPPLAILTGKYFTTVRAQRTIGIKIGFIALPIFSISLVLFLLTSHSYVEPRSIKPLAQYILTNQLLNHHDNAPILISYKHYYQDLPFYLQRRIIIANCASELDFGKQLVASKNWFLNKQEFLKKWQGPQKIIAISRKFDYKTLITQYTGLKTHILAKTQRNVLYSNY